MNALGVAARLPSAAELIRRAIRVLPQGGQLPDQIWRERHRWIVRLLWVHTVLIPAYGLTQGFSPGHLVLETVAPVVAALASNAGGVDRRIRTVVASLGLLTCSGILVHLSGGLIEMHFHFFVIVAVVSLYQDWLPFLTAIAYVFLQHGIFGALTTGSVFNHPDAVAHPWRWAGVHAAFITAESVACLTNWRLNETLYASERDARMSAERARSDLALLVDATEVLTSSFDLHVMLQGLVELVVPALAGGASVHLLDRETGTLTEVAATGSGAMVLSQIAECLPEGKVVAPVDVDGHSPSVVVPITGRGELLGTLALTCLPTESCVPEATSRVAVELGRRAGIAVENATLYARERSVALTLQHALLPERIPQVPGLDTAAQYVAGGLGVDVGGDWYDVIPLARGRLLLVMGDVVGRGHRAAALMGQLRSALRGHALVQESPAALLGHLNRLLEGATGAQMATLLCALLDLETGALTVANAGHPPGALRDPEGRVCWLAEATGPPLGTVPGATYTEVLCDVQPGSTLLFYTDGVVEERTTSLDSGLAQLAGVLADGPEPADELCAHVLKQMLSDARAADDAAVLAVRLMPLGDRLEFALPRDASTLQPLRATLRRWLRARGACPVETYELLLAVSEAVTSALGHPLGAGESPVHLVVELDGAVLVEVRALGSRQRTRSEAEGRRLQVMTACMDEVQVDDTAAGVHTVMRRRLGTPA